jgi:NTP pyrophosphatase (non-canonical NTP hydrolase)
MNQSDFKLLQDKALYIKNFYNEKQKAKGAPLWTASDYMAGFVADMGELSELVMAKKGLRVVEDVDEKLTHELSDCLYSIFVIADELNVDIESTFSKNMDMLAERIEKKGR